MKLTASPHTHVESPISGSTMKSMVDAAVTLGRTHFSYTDPAFMTSAYRAYEYATKKGLKYIPGIEIFFKDFNCPIVKDSASNRARYFKLTLHAQDQAAFQKLCQLSSKERNKSVTSYGSDFPLWDWSDLEECKDFNIFACNSDIHDMVAKHLITGKHELTLPILERLISIFGRKLYLTIIGNHSDRVWESFVKLTYSDGTGDLLFARDRVKTGGYYAGVQAREIPQNMRKHAEVESYVTNGRYRKVGKIVVGAELKEGFVKIPGTDPQVRANKLMIKLAMRYSLFLLYSDYAYYAAKEDKRVQDVRLSSDDIKEWTVRHMQTTEEALDYLTNTMGLDAEDSERILKNNEQWAANFNEFKLEYNYSIPEVEGGEDPLKISMEIIEKNGRMKWDDPAYVNQLMREIKVLAKNGKVNLLPYFFPIRDVLNHYKENHRLTGPARGSAAGSLFMYLMGITQVDPIKYETSFDRFLSLDRVLTGNWPDVDVDLVSRDLLVGKDARSGYLYGRWGNRAAQISTRINMRLKSSIKDVNRYIKGAVEPEVEKLSKSLPPPPQGVADSDFVFGYTDDEGVEHAGLLEINEDLQKYANERPDEWDLVCRCLGIARQHSKHASAFVIADKPIADIVPMFMGNITQYEAKGVEKCKLIKFDFLVVKQLEDIEKCIALINKKNGDQHSVTHFRQGEDMRYVWDLPEDESVYKSIWNGDTETIFQLKTRSMQPFVIAIKPKSIFDISDILALDRPGPLDYVDEDTGRTMADEYIWRRQGKAEPNIKILAELLPKTYGVMVYQEQITQIAKEIGGMKADDAENLRRLMSKKEKVAMLQMKPLFMAGATEKLGEELAEKIWDMMATFARYGFNKAHSIAYAMITYASMYLKHYYPKEWWSAILTNADESEITNVLYKHVREFLAAPDINMSTNEMVIDYNTNKIRSKITVLKGLGEGKAAEAIVAGRPYADMKDFVRKRVAGPSLTKKLILAGVMDSLFPRDFDLVKKMMAYELAEKEIGYDEKIAAGKKAKPVDPSTVKIDEKYIGMHPLTEYLEKKAILPTLPFSLYDLIVKHYQHLNVGSEEKPAILTDKGRTSRMVRGEQAQTLDTFMNTGEENIYFCCPGYVMKAEEFSYAKGAKKALKMVIDADGYICERVIWPDYDSGELKYPSNLAKGSACIFFMGRRPNKDQTSIYSVKVLDERS